MEAEQAQAAQGTGAVEKKFDFKASSMKPTKVTWGGEVKIIDSKIFPVTQISAAIVTLKPGGLRELHWLRTPMSGSTTSLIRAARRFSPQGPPPARWTFEEGDVGYVPISNPHYIQNTSDTDLVFLEMFKSREYQDISLAEWMAHTPHLLMNQYLGVGMTMLDRIPKQEAVVAPV